MLIVEFDDGVVGTASCVKRYDTDDYGRSREADPGLEVDRKAKALMAQNPALNYAEAYRRILDADPELKALYALGVR